MAIWVLACCPHFDKRSQRMVGKAMGSVASDDGFPSKSGRGREGVEEKE
jgi:hypothetical protein